MLADMTHSSFFLKCSRPDRVVKTSLTLPTYLWGGQGHLNINCYQLHNARDANESFIKNGNSCV